MTDIFAPYCPPGWPDTLPPPPTDDWEQAATRWLRTLAPAHWAEYPVYHSSSWLLARALRYDIEAQLAGLRESWRMVRVETTERVGPEVVEEYLEMHQAEATRLKALKAELWLIEQALAGTRWLPPRTTPKRSGGWG